MARSWAEGPGGWVWLMCDCGSAQHLCLLRSMAELRGAGARSTLPNATGWTLSSPFVNLNCGSLVVHSEGRTMNIICDLTRDVATVPR